MSIQRFDREGTAHVNGPYTDAEVTERLYEALHFYAYPGDYEGRPTNAEMQEKARSALAAARGES